MKIKSKILGCLVLVVLSCGAFADDLLIRGKVVAPDGTDIAFSAPVQLLEALKTSGVSAIVNDKDKFNELLDSLIGDLASIKGKDLLKINMGKNVARISVDEVSDDHPEEANFVKVDVKPAGKDQPEVHFSLPKGIFFLGTFICNQIMETYGKDLMELVKQQITMNCMPPAAEGACKAPCCEKEEKEGKEESEETKETHKEKKKDLNPDKIKELILEKLLKELK